MAKCFTGALDAVSHKWRRLAERRQADLTELFHSGRWKHYYTEEQFLRYMREAVQLTERWVAIAPPAAEAALRDGAPTSDALTFDAAAPAPVRRDAA
jgi:uncharacterized repeat protein (TIGR03809 family)